MKFVIKRIVVFIALVSCAQGAQADGLDEILRTAALKNGLVPTAQLFDDTDSALAEPGKLFFKSKAVSLNGNIACQTCHLDEFGSTDGLPNAVGVEGEGQGPDRGFSSGRIVPRNTLPFWGRGGKGFNQFFWDGKVDYSGKQRISQFGDNAPADDALVIAALLPPTEFSEMISRDPGISPLTRETPDAGKQLYARIMRQLRQAEPQAVAVLASKLGKQPQELSFIDVARSIASFIRAEFRLRDTKFHGFVFGKARLSPAERRGGLLFYGKGKCVNCHTGPYFTDFKYHAVPFPQLGFGKNGFGIDYGRYNVTYDPEDLYKFRTPPLFNVDKTAPYGHSGSVATLEEAVRVHFDPLPLIDSSTMAPLARHEYYKRLSAASDDILRIGFLSDEEVKDIAAFLRTLSF